MFYACTWKENVFNLKLNYDNGMMVRNLIGKYM